MIQKSTITHKRVLSIALPIVLSNATVPLLGLVDTGVLGQLNDPIPVGAVGLGASALGLIFWFFGFLRMGTAGLTAQAYGQNQMTEVHALLWRVLMIGFSAGLLILVLRPLLFIGVFALSPASPEVESLARDYMHIRIYSAPATIATYGIIGWLIASERTKSVLALQLFVNLTNIILDIIFVLHLNAGVAGVAYASVIAEWSGLGLGLWLCRAYFRPAFTLTWAHIYDAKRLRYMMQANTDIMIRSILLQIVFLTFVFQGSKLGDYPLAANQILMQFLFVSAYAMDGFVYASETLAGKAFAQKSLHDFRRAVSLSTLWTAVAAIILMLTFILLGPLIIELMSDNTTIRSYALTYMPYIIAAPIFGLGAWVLDGIFIGTVQTRPMRDMMLISTLSYLISLPILTLWLGNHGLWIALLLNFGVRTATLAYHYPRIEALLD